MKRHWLVVLALAACGGEPTRPPAPGTVTVEFTTPATNDRAMLLRVSGPGIASVEAAGTGYEMRSRTRGDTVRIAVFGDLQTGPALRVNVADVNQLAAFRATLLEVADDANALRVGLGSYRLTLR